ncbi:single-stranded-DNA-specific exonuclease RecJ [Companilactobacillus sp. DQM5]|uniref:single-stranded-DNA-specific exonuclease RecJ n=1 Tax=Companilactobacillus sp. DQM5 TaxID=3463359 RepID=UPI0040584687
MDKNWKLRKKIDNNLVTSLSNKLGLPIITVKLLVSRNIDTEEKITDFLDTSIEKIDDPFKLNDMQKAIDRIEQALDNNEKIVIYGDYDSDGLTSTSIMKEAIEIIGGQVDTYIPDRFSDGYGPNIERYQEFINQGYQLIITVDNGVSGYEAVELAQNNNVDVIITDHHTLPEKLPNATAIIHPRIKGNEYSCQDLSGAGVAFKVASALLQEVPLDLLDLAAIGTISDVVKLSGENKVIVANGIKQIQSGNRIGLKELFKTIKLDIKKVDEEVIGYQIAPRLNALGRIKNANIGVDLLTEQDIDSVKKIAKEVDETNSLRRQYSDEIYQKASKKLSRNKMKFQVLYDDNWNEGVLGIVAGKISDETNKPTLVLSKHGDVYKGSGRSPIGFNLFEALEKHKDLYTSFGGHAQACGVSIKTDKIEEFSDIIQKEIDIQGFNKVEEKECIYDLNLDTKEISFTLLDQINILAPFGEGNPKPIFKSSNVEIVDEKNIGNDKTHLKGKIKQNQIKTEFIAFRFSNEFNTIKDIPLYDAYYQIGINEWLGKKNIQLMISDIRSDKFGTQFIDWRNHEFDIKKLDNDLSLIFFNKRYFDLFEQRGNDISAYLWNNPQISKLNKILVFDRPHNINNFKKFIDVQQAQFVYLLFYSQLKYSYELVPDKKEMHDTLKFFLTHQGIRENDYQTISKYLNININNLKFYINVFFELGFVKINGGVISSQQIDKNKNLESSLFYQKRLQRNEVGSLLVNSSYQDLLSWIEKQ